MKKQGITIAIPAYNEENNIRNLLKNLLTQKQDGFVIESILVVSDGSTDNTVKYAQSIKDKRIRVMGLQKRQGRAVVQNIIFEKINSDNIVLLDADTTLPQRNFVAKIMKPILNGADLTSARVEELLPHTFIESILYASMQWKKNMFENIDKGNNIFTCHGRSRAFSKRLYKSIKFKKSVGEDAYSFFYCKSKGMQYSYVKDAYIYYKLPSVWKDHVSQSKRYFSSKKLFIQEFGEDVINKEYALPITIALNSFFKSTLEHPLLLLYFPLSVITKISSLFDYSAKDTWAISHSSKVIGGVI